MEKLEFENYFTNIKNNNNYYNPKIMITILEDIFKRNIFDVEREIDSWNIKVDKYKIIEFLDQKEKEETFYVLRGIEDDKKKLNPIVVKWTKEDMKNNYQDFFYKLSTYRYTFHPYTLKYFIKYTSIVRDKINELISIIKNLSTKKIDVIEEELIRLDINLNENNDIHKSDIIRLIIPTIYNIKLLADKINEANNLETYLTFKITPLSLRGEGVWPEELYPYKSLQIKSLEYDGHPGYISLTDNQKQELWNIRDKYDKMIYEITKEEIEFVRQELEPEKYKNDSINLKDEKKKQKKLEFIRKIFPWIK